MKQKLTTVLLTITLLFCLAQINAFAATTADEYYKQGCEYYDQEEFEEAAEGI